jgi:NAD(P)-dependent dehydrogenase (short-subunit alcohol dehydrogenase family)
LAVNHLAPFLLTNELLSLLLAAPDGRVITVSSDSHYRTWIDLNRLNSPLPYIGLWAYKVSKLANVLFTLELNRRLTGSTVRAFAVDPGLVNTGIAEKGGPGLSRLVWRFRRSSGTPPEVPARTILYLAGAPIPKENAAFYWRDLEPVLPSRQARDGRMAQALWELSSRMVHLEQEEQR